MISKHIDFERIYESNVSEQNQIVNILYAKLEIRKTFLPSGSDIRAPHDPSQGKSIRGTKVGGKGTSSKLGIRKAKHNRSEILSKKYKTRCLKS